MEHLSLHEDSHVTEDKRQHTLESYIPNVSNDSCAMTCLASSLASLQAGGHEGKGQVLQQFLLDYMKLFFFVVCSIFEWLHSSLI